MKIQFTISGQLLIADNIPLLADRQQNFLEAQFNFNNEWANTIKTGVFTKDDETYLALLDENNTCIVPNEITNKDGTIRVGVFGVHGTKRITTNLVELDIREGSYMDGETPIEPTPDIFEQILAAYNDLLIKVNNLSEGVGVPTSGLKGQILAKASNEDFDTEWITNAGGSVDLFIIVDELPEVGEANKIYLVPNGNEFNEFIFINGSWEQIGTIDIDLSNYYTIDEIDIIVSNLKSEITNYIDESIRTAILDSWAGEY